MYIHAYIYTKYFVLYSQKRCCHKPPAADGDFITPFTNNICNNMYSYIFRCVHVQIDAVTT